MQRAWALPSFSCGSTGHGTNSIFRRDGGVWGSACLPVGLEWARHELHIPAGREPVAIDGRGQDDTWVEVGKALELFGELWREGGFPVDWRFRCARGGDRHYANQVLGF